MELELTRIDYTNVGITSNHCLKLLPSTNNKDQQKVAVADTDGILQLFSIKKEDIQLHFKTLPGPKISCLQLGGEINSVQDKIFVCSENEVRGYTKKGKLFLSFDSNLTEPINSMFILGNELFLCGKHIYNHYRDCKDVGSYLCGDCIVDVVALYSEKTHRLISLIACEGRMIRALEHARVTSTMEIESTPTILHIYENESTKYVLFGTIDGRVGLLNTESLQAFDRWVIKGNENTSAIICMDSYDINGDGNKNLIIGRQDGNVEVYIVYINDSLDNPVLIYSHNCNESVTSLQCGVVGCLSYDEILVVTYTGRIFGLTTQVIEKILGAENNAGKYSYSADTNLKITKLKNEIEELQQKIAKERLTYQSSTQSFFDEISAIPILSIRDSMVLSQTSASYTLTLEVPAPIDNVLLQSNVPIDLLDVEKNSAVVSYSDPDLQGGNFLLATYRCQMNTSRLELRIRTIEGQKGTLQLYITPMVQPKCCQVRKFLIKPLSLHLRIYNFDENRHYNALTLKGQFSLAEIHSWLSQCFPEVPEKPLIGEKTILYFQSTLLDTVVKCSYSKGEGEFTSDNISAISVLKEFLTKEATKKKIKVDLNTVVSDESINQTLKLIDPKLKKYMDLSKQVKLLDALNELGINDEETLNCISPKYKSILDQEKSMRSQYNEEPSYLDRLFGAVTDLYIDYYKFKGTNVKSKVPKLVMLLENYNYDDLLSFFRPDMSTSV